MADEIAYLIAGLGNPGAEYENTPHNLGFKVVDRLAEANAIRVSRKENSAYVGLGNIRDQRVALAKPQMFMNLSGPPVKGLLERYGLGPSRLILVYDELALPWQELRIRTNGSAAGHNGVKSVIGSLATDGFIRVRLGIHTPGRATGRSDGDGARFVLGQFAKARKQEVEDVVGRGCSAVESILADGVEKSMAVFNRRAGGLNTEGE